MINAELVSIFEDLADMEEIEGNRWESLAYRKVANSISLLSEDVKELYSKKQLRNIDGVGSSIEKKIIEYIETGRVEKHEKMKSLFDVDFRTLRGVQGLGPKRIAVLHRELGIKNLDDLISAIKDNRVSSVPGFGPKSQESLNRSIEAFLAMGSERKPIALCYDDIQHLLETLRKSGKFTDVEVAGSARRMKDTIGDIDILASSDNPGSGADYFVSLESVRHVIAKGETKIAVLLDMGLNCDLRIIDRSSFGAALQYFTGSKEHNIRLRDMAINAGMKLNEYGLYRGERRVAGSDETEVYRALGLDYIPPELRENMGEIEASETHRLPDLVEFSEILGDFHCHTSATDGHSTLEEMITAASSLKYKYMAITEHSRSLRVANGLDEKGFSKRGAEIDAINSSQGRILVLKGVELEILKDGTLDLENSTLDSLDIVVGAMHQWVSSDQKENTRRLVKAIESGRLTILAHPTGRLIGSREPYRIDFDTVFQACADYGVALEVNGYPTRSDLPYDLVKRASGYKVKFALGSDAHSADQLRFMKFSTAIARRGWLESGDIMNTQLFQSAV